MRLAFSRSAALHARHVTRWRLCVPKARFASSQPPSARAQWHPSDHPAPRGPRSGSPEVNLPDCLSVKGVKERRVRLPETAVAVRGSGWRRLAILASRHDRRKAPMRTRTIRGSFLRASARLASLASPASCASHHDPSSGSMESHPEFDGSALDFAIRSSNAGRRYRQRP
jgi:hypothetical protein